MDRVVLGLVLAPVGGLLVAPRLVDAAQRWIGWRVVLPLFLGRVPDRVELGPPLRRSAAPTRGVRAVQVVTAVVFGVAGLSFGWSAALVPVLVLLAGLVAISAVDFVCWRIPTRFVYLTGASVLAGLVLAAVVVGEPGSLGGAALGAGFYLVLLGGMHLLSPRMLGFGDVRLGGLIGMAVGWVGWLSEHPVAGPLSLTMLAVFLASIVGSIAGIVVLLVRRRARRLSSRPLSEAYPFGPWLCLGGFLAMLAAAPGPG